MQALVGVLGKVALAVLSLFLDKLYVWYIEYLKKEAERNALDKERKLRELEKANAVEEEMRKAQKEMIEADMSKAEYDRRVEDIHNWHNGGTKYKGENGT